MVRSTIIGVRVSREELETIREKASENGITVSAYMRFCALRGLALRDVWRINASEALGLPYGTIRRLMVRSVTPVEFFTLVKETSRADVSIVGERVYVKNGPLRYEAHLRGIRETIIDITEAYGKALEGMLQKPSSS